MSSYLHRIYGIYSNKNEAEQVLEQLLQCDFKQEQLTLINKQSKSQEIAPDSDEVRDEMLTDGAIGTAVGAGIGALGEAVIAAVNISLFVASPVVATLVMMGWGASIGALIGVGVGAGTENTKHFSDLVRDAVSQGHTVLIAYANNEKQTVAAQELIANSVQDLKQTV